MLSAVQSRDAEIISCLAGDDTNWEIPLGISKQGQKAGMKISSEPYCQPKWQGVNHSNILTSHFSTSLGGSIHLSIRCHSMSAGTKREKLLHRIHLIQLSTHQSHMPTPSVSERFTSPH